MANTPLPRTAKLLFVFVLANVVFMILFMLIRIPVMTDENYVLHGGRSPKRGWHSLISSVLTQTTLGDSTVQPISTIAEAITVIQSISTVGSVLIIGAMVAISAKKHKRA